jgi:ketosteroid isomerase-like protein
VSTVDSEVRAAAAALVRAFGAHDVAGYFGAFAPDATFLFHTTDRLLSSRAAYEAEWADWEAGGFHVLACKSLDGHVQPLAAGVAVFTHRVRTRVRDADGEHDLAERETIVFRREADGRWLGVHEHLSPQP